MGEKTSKTSSFAATLLIFVNFITMTIAVLSFACGLWIIVSPRTLASVIEGVGNPTVRYLLPPAVLTAHLGVALAGVAIFVFFVSFFGFYGAVSRSPFLLFMYSTLVILLLLLECALVYYFTSSFSEKGLQERDGQWTHALRLAFQCCERNSSAAQEVTRIPWSCCGHTTYPENCTVNRLYGQNCNHVITSWLDRYQTGIYASLTVLHLLLSSCSIIRRRRSLSRSYS